MKDIFKPGDTKTYTHKVTEADVAQFHGEVVHAFYSTYALARDAEWSSRLFVLEMKDADEEGIGTFVHVNHHAPALVGDEVLFTATYKTLKGNELICDITVHAGDRLLATCSTGQKIVKKEKLSALAEKLRNRPD